ncbi:MAG: bifunctional oligoribonuclease/PAP phosphatase NrnA [Treponema sp.]|nr:bifunctional oligoribonuclease/PAP phosphatase NrnA [Treponema sp.]
MKPAPAKPVPAELLDFIRTGTKFLTAGHEDEDGDCAGSQLALCSVLRRLGKEAIPCSTGPFNRTEIKSFEKFFCAEIDEKTKEGSRVIIADCGRLERTGRLSSLLNGLPAAYIDHHHRDPGALQSNGNIFYVCEESPSTTLMILNLIDALGLELTTDEAELLMFGLCTDTGFFRHTDSGFPQAFEAAARLVGAGASPKKIHREIYGGKSLDSRILMGRILGRTESYFNGKLLVSAEDYEEIRLYGAEGKDSDMLYQLLQSVAGTEAIAIISQKKPDTCNVGLRSRDNIDVAAIAEVLGGGGHKNAAGAAVAGTIDEVKPKLLDLFKKII